MRRRRKADAIDRHIKAKLESVETGAGSFEDEFLPYTMLPDGSAVAEWIGPQMEQAASTGQMPSMLPGLGGPSTSIALGSGRT